MSQVKKLATGGTFIIDGQEISGTDALNAVRSNLGETTGGIMNALQEGATVNYNSADNTIRITGSNGKVVTDNYLPAGEKASPLDSTFKKDFGATFHTKTDRFKRDLLKLRGVTVPIKSQQDETSSLTQLRKGSGWFYTKDKDGNNIYLEGPANADRMSIIKGIREYVEHYQDSGEEASKKKYNISGWNNDNLSALRNYFANIGYADRQGYWKGLLDRIQTDGGKNLTDVDKETLRLMGFDDSGNGQTVSEGSGNGKPTIDADWTGDREAAERLGIGIRKNKDGYWEIYGDNPYATGTWYNRGINFLKGTPWETGAIHNGRLYTQGDVFGGKYLDLSEAMSPFISAWRDETADWNTRWNNALNSGVNWYGMDNNIYANAGDPTKRYAQYWTRYFTDNNMSGNYNLVDVSNAFSNVGDKQIVSYIDGTNRNIYGIDEPVYLVRDVDGNITKYDNYTALMSESGLVENNDIYGFAPKDIHMEEYRPIKGRDYAEYGRFGPQGQENTILIGRDGYLYLSRGNDTKPKRVYDIDKLMKILAGEAFENKDLDAITLTKGDYRWNPVTPFRQKRSQMVANEQQRRAEIENPSLNKFQWGGSIQKVRSSAVSNDPSTQKYDYTKAHALDGSDGKLTDAEWMQIGSAVGDLAGVGLSFVPVVGGVVGATTGAAASTTKFIADIKQDGYQGKDLRHYLGNLVLDAASILPVVGTGAKAAKAAKVIKSVGKPLIKLLSITGATAPVITAVTKISNGEKYTSEDLTTAIRGIGAGIIATKSIKDSIGNARLAKSVATKAAESANSITSNGITKSAEEIAQVINGKTKLDATKELKTLFKNGEQELSQSDAAKLLDDLGVEFNKGKITSFKPKNWGKILTGKGRGHKIVEFTPQQEGTTFGYMINPWKRSKVLGSEAVFGFGKNPGLIKGNVTAEEINTAINAPKATLTQQALMRMTAENPQAFGDLFKIGNGFVPTNIKSGWYFSGNRYYRKAPTMSQAEPVKVNYGNSFGKYLPVLYRPQVQSEVLVPETVVPQGSFFNVRKSLPQGFIPRGLLGQRNPQVNPIYGPGLVKYQSPRYYNNGFVVYGPSNTSFTFKKGGKIIKGERGLPNLPTISDKNKKIVESALSSQKAISPLMQTVVDANGIEHTYHGPSISESIAQENAKKIQDPGGIPTSGWAINSPNLDDTLRAGVTAWGIYKDRDLQRLALGELYKRQFQAPQFNVPRLDTSYIQQSFHEALKPYVESNFVTSDARDSMAFKLSKAQQISSLNSQKNAQLDQQLNQFRETKRQIDDKNEALRTDMANQKSQYITGLRYQDKMLDSVALNRLFSDVIVPFGQQMSQQGRDAWNRNAQLNYQIYAKQATDAENARIAKAFNDKYGNAWNKLSDKERAGYGNIEDYVYSVDPVFWKDTKKPSLEYNTGMQLANKSYNNIAGAGLFYRPLDIYKSGGTINIKNNNKNLRPTQEQIAINGAKSAKRSVDELSKALLRMLQQLTK